MAKQQSAVGAVRRVQRDARGFLLIAKPYRKWVPVDTIEAACDLLFAIASSEANGWLIGELTSGKPVRFLFEGWVNYGVAEQHFDPDWLPDRRQDIEAHLHAAFAPFLAEGEFPPLLRVTRIYNHQGKGGYCVQAWLTIKGEFVNSLMLRVSQGVATVRRGQSKLCAVTGPGLQFVL